jgi:hypothetical protein
LRRSEYDLAAESLDLERPCLGTRPPFSFRFGELKGDLEPFLNWAFGPDGINSLKVVVYGDLSPHCVRKDSYKAYCRSEQEAVFSGQKYGQIPRYRLLNDEEWRDLSLRKKHQSLLEACPTLDAMEIVVTGLDQKIR